MCPRLSQRFPQFALLWLLVLQGTSAWVSNTAQRHHHLRQLLPLSVKKTRVLDDAITSSSSSTTTTTTTTTTQPKATIQILMSDTGGGHRASANALRDAWNTLYPNQIECDIVDIYTEYGPVWPYNDYVRMYKLMAQYPWTWDLFFRFGSTPFGLWLNAFLLETICFQSFVTCLQQPDFITTKKRADMVVSVHPLCQDIALKILAYLDTNGATRDPQYRTTPFCTVVTDLGGAHPTWFHPQVDQCFVPSDALRQLALQRNLQPSQIVQHGLPIRQGFWNSPLSSTEQPSSTTTTSNTKAPRHTALGLHPELPTVLLVGGGDGMGGLVEMALSLQQELQDAQLVVICGNNRAAQETLQQHSAANNMVVRGFVSNMDEYMRAADVLVTKAGPGTIAEACICGLPCMLFAYLPGQEEGNIPFVEQGGFGAYCSDPKEIATTVRSWIADPQQLAVMQENAFKAARPQATLDIARDLAEIVFRHNEKKVDGGTGKGESSGVVEASL